MNIEIYTTSSFDKSLKKAEKGLRLVVIDKVGLFQNPENHKSLKVHKLKGKLKNRYSFSVDYKNRIVFKYKNSKKQKAVLLAFGSHSIYEE